MKLIDHRNELTQLGYWFISVVSCAIVVIIFVVTNYGNYVFCSNHFKDEKVACLLSNRYRAVSE